MIGGGSFNLPANMAGGAGLVAIGIAWVVTFIGMYFLSNSFRILSDKRPDLKGGIYSYAAAGFGPFAGFQMAWGYWLSSAFGNVAFAVLIMQILSYFFPIFGNGQNWPSIIGGSVLIWVMFGVVLSGVKRTAALSVLASILNITTISFALIIMAFFMTGGKFTFDIWGHKNHLGNIFTQVKSTMLVTLWVFIGIEAAVVLSDRAKKMSDIGPATFIGLGVCTLLYALLSILPFGIMHQGDIAGLSNPSTAYILSSVVGKWGAVFINVSLLLAVLSCWLAWTILVAELPFEGAKGGVFPKFLAKENRFHAAAPSLVISSLVMQGTLFIVLYRCDDPAALSRQRVVFDALRLAARLCRDAFGKPQGRDDNGHSGRGLFHLAAVRGRARILADVHDCVRGRHPGFLVCKAGTFSPPGGVFQRRKGRGRPARRGRGGGPGAVRQGRRHNYLNFQ
jgi:arginine:ornithine antiporter/lysine permease